MAGPFVPLDGLEGSAIQPRKDQDQFLFVCKPRSGACPPASPSGAFLR